jgi:hypothetical protein
MGLTTAHCKKTYYEQFTQASDLKYWWESQGKTSLGRPRRRWVDNIRTELGEVGWGDVDWIGLAKDRNR